MPTSHIGTVVTVVTFLGGLLAWYRASVETSVSLKRDWGHLRKNQEQMIENISFLSKETDVRLDRVDTQLVEIKSMFYASLARRNEA